MATKKASTKKSTSSRTSAAKKTTKTTVAKSETVAAAAKTASTTKKVAKVWPPKNLAGVILAEVVGTLILTLVALTTASLGVWYVGVALVVLIMVIGGISGAHVNPAVSFGLWTLRKINWKDLLVYWVSQVVGAMLAVVLMVIFTNGQFSMGFGNFADFQWALFGIELIATAIFLFGLTAVLAREELSTGLKAFGIGLSLTIGLVAGGAILDQVKTADYTAYQKTASTSTEETSLPHSLFVKGVVANPAVALATTESTESQLTGSSSGSETPQSRFTLDLLLGTLIGGAIGAQLFRVVSYRPRD